MINILKNEYWSRADAFLLPLVGLSKQTKYNVSSHLFWGNYSIENYQLILSFSYDWDEKDEFVQYCRYTIFPILDKKGYLVESYDVGDRTIMILDISEWALDIQMLLEGKYSKISKEGKGLIQKFHTYDGQRMPISIYAVLYPNEKIKELSDMTAIEYVAKEYECVLEDMQKIGEIGSIYSRTLETLRITVDDILSDGVCHSGS